MPSLSAYHLTWVSFTLDMGYLFLAATPNLGHGVYSLGHSCATQPPLLGSIKDRNSMDLTEAEDIKKRWQEYTEEL